LKYEILVSEEKGITIGFEGLKGLPVLNAIQVRKI